MYNCYIKNKSNSNKYIPPSFKELRATYLDLYLCPRDSLLILFLILQLSKFFYFFNVDFHFRKKHTILQMLVKEEWKNKSCGMTIWMDSFRLWPGYIETHLLWMFVWVIRFSWHKQLPKVGFTILFTLRRLDF